MRFRPSLTAVLLVVLPATAASCGGGGTSTSGTTASKPALTTSTTSRAVPSTVPPPPPTSAAVWPTTMSGTRYETPAAAAQGFATSFLHMAGPIVGTFQQSSTGSGQVPIQATGTGPVTTVAVSRLGSDQSWWVTGSSTPDIRLTQPTSGALVSSPVMLAGSAQAFEGVVKTQVREDDNTQPIGDGVVTAGMAMTPFTGSVTYSAARTKYGALVLFTVSAKDGSVVEASVTRLRLG